MWRIRGKELKDFDIPKEAIGFVYYMCTDEGKFYIGKKNLFTDRWQEVSENVYRKLKAEGAEVKKTKNKALSKAGEPVWRYKKRVIKESDWRTYKSSNKELKKFPVDRLVRDILCFCTTKQELTYWETYYQFYYDCLNDEECYNDNILGKFYSGVVTPEFFKINNYDK